MAAARRLGKGDLSFSEFLAHIRESREFQFKSKEEGLAFFNELIHNKINPKLKQVLPDRCMRGLTCGSPSHDCSSNDPSRGIPSPGCW